MISNDKAALHWARVCDLLRNADDDLEPVHFQIAERASLLTTEAARLAGCSVEHGHMAIIETSAQAEEVLATIAAAFAQVIACTATALTHAAHENATRTGGRIGTALQGAVAELLAIERLAQETGRRSP